LKIRLPTEIEWEKAAKDSHDIIYPWGNEMDSGRANLAKTGIGTTPSVGCFNSGISPYGCHDMLGNVCKIVDNHQQKVKIEKDRKDHFIVKGGSFKDEAESIECSSRIEITPEFRSNCIGFRIAADFSVSQFGGGKIYNENKNNADCVIAAACKSACIGI
jgi:formylglycine-generating enzyme required for sulfatase activity